MKGLSWPSRRMKNDVLTRRVEQHHVGTCTSRPLLSALGIANMLRHQPVQRACLPCTIWAAGARITCVHASRTGMASSACRASLLGAWCGPGMSTCWPRSILPRLHVVERIMGKKTTKDTAFASSSNGRDTVMKSRFSR